MRQGANAKRSQGRGNGRAGGNSRNQRSGGNGTVVRGSARQIMEKYFTLAREASTSGDRIVAEGFFQHAEHYFRLMTANGGHEGRETNSRTQEVNNDGKLQSAIDGTANTPGPVLEDAPVTNGANKSVSDPASAPQPDSETTQAAQPK